MRKSAFNFKARALPLFATFFLCLPHATQADGPLLESTWPQFRRQVQDEAENSSRKGTALIVSSTLLVGGSFVLRVQDPVQNGVVGLIRTVGLLGIGEGAEQIWVSDQRRIFQETLDRSLGLAETSKTEILKHYLELQQEARKHRNTIKVATYSLVAAVNFYEASRQTDETVKTGLIFLGAVGLLRTLTLTIDF